jgi:hypothetical protein
MLDIGQLIEPAWVWLNNFAVQVVPNYILPNLQLIIQVALLLIGGYVVGRIAKSITIRLLAMAGLKKITLRTWTDDILKAVGYKGNIIGLIGDLVKWFIYILVFGLIIEALGFAGVFSIFSQIAGFVPRFIAAILIIVVGFLIADFMGRVFEEAGRSMLRDEVISFVSGGLAKYSIAIITIIMALSIMGLDTASLNIIFAVILVSVVALTIIGVKDIMPNIAAGVHLRRNLKVGERIRINGHTGLVERIDSASVILRVSDSKRVSVPSSFFVRSPYERVRK